MVREMKPMGRTTSRANLGVVPVQKRRRPSSVKIRYAQWNELRYCARASSDCIRVLITLARQRKYEIVVQRRGLNHALERHGGVYGDEASNRADGERDATGQRLSCARAALYGLLERSVRREADGRIGTLPHHL